MALACAWITLHKFISCPIPCRGHEGSFFLFIIIFQGLYALLWNFALHRLGILVALAGLLFSFVFLLSFTLHMKISSTVSRRSHNSKSPVSPWVTKSNTWIIYHLCHLLGIKNYNILSILPSVNPWLIPKSGNFNGYSTIFPNRQMKSQCFYRGACTAPFGVNSSGSGSHLVGRNGWSSPSLPIRSLRWFRHKKPEGLSND